MMHIFMLFQPRPLIPVEILPFYSMPIPLYPLPPSHFSLLHSALGWSAQFRPDVCYSQWKSENPKDTTTSCGSSDNFLNLSKTWVFLINQMCLIMQVKASSRCPLSVTGLLPLLLLVSVFEEHFPTEGTLLKALHSSVLYHTRRWKVQ